MTARVESFTAVAPLQAHLAEARAKGRRIAVVPTMGALHAGHLALCTEARRHADLVVTTIFVNPTQFGPSEDFGRYPRTLDADLAACARVGVDVVFAPDDPSVIYPEGDQTRVRVPEVARWFEGEIRPHHFEGVATVCLKLFHIVGPGTAVFGRKDYQQLQVIKRLVRDLFLPVTIVGHPTQREADGLALSSRNVYLSKQDREAALAIPRGLAAAVRAFSSGERRIEELERLARAEVAGSARSVDYVSCAHPDDMTPLAGTAPDRVLLAIAARYGTTRLIDNVVLGEDPGPTVADDRTVAA
ncbi:MAG: pantoate--beta-alanine ligase [Myxococcales bacterium]|nr:pantoate--beta-alanine ligase [Myxococcales bacterium]